MGIHDTIMASAYPLLIVVGMAAAIPPRRAIAMARLTARMSRTERVTEGLTSKWWNW